MVTGIYSYNDPNQNYPADLDSVVFRDPQSNARFQVSMTTWEQGGLAVPGWGTYSLWSGWYTAATDPDPIKGPYTPASGQTHWRFGFAWIQRDNHGGSNDWNPDWAYTSTDIKLTTP
jgi:hypothetical protein